MKSQDMMCEAYFNIFVQNEIILNLKLVYKVKLKLHKLMCYLFYSNFEGFYIMTGSHPPPRELAKTHEC
jgi:hypothetical protein